MSIQGPDTVLIARQPILNANRAVFGYELAYHFPDSAEANQQCGSERMLDCLTSAFDPKILANRRCIFVQLTTQAITDQSYKQLPAESTIIELDATGVEWNQELIDACRALKQSGYRLCLVGGLAEFDAAGDLGECVDFLKLNSRRDFDAPDCQQRLAAVARTCLQMIASGIEQPEQFEQAKQAGFDLFEGYFFFKPQILEQREIPTTQMNHLRFLQAVNQPDLNVAELEKIIRGDAKLCIGLLRLINSAAFGMTKKIDSVQRALLLLGPKKVKQWATSLVAKQIAGEKPAEIISICLTRAFFCEALGGATKQNECQLDLFMMGIVSGLPAMLDVPLIKLLDELSIGEEIRIGLSGGDTPMGRIFTLACAHERGEFTAMSKMSEELKLDIGDLAHLYHATTRDVQGILDEPQQAAAA